MTWLLRPGLGVARREAGLVQVGIDPPQVAVLPDRPEVRALLVVLAHGGPVPALDEVTAGALEALVRAQLVVSLEDEVARPLLRARFRVHVDAPEDVLTPALVALAGAGLGRAREPLAAQAVLAWTVGEPPRARLDGWMRAGTAHLVVRETPHGPLVGPYVRPGATACLRCADAHAAEGDPRRALVVEQLADQPPLRPAPADPAGRALALAWAVRDLVTVADGGRPGTWSAVASLATLPPRVTPYRRHPHCGCAWDLLSRTG